MRVMVRLADLHEVEAGNMRMLAAETWNGVGTGSE